MMRNFFRRGSAPPRESNSAGVIGTPALRDQTLRIKRLS